MDNKRKTEITLTIYNFILGLHILLDEGKFEAIEEIINVCEKGNIYQYINDKYNLPFWQNIDIDKYTINKLFENSGVDIERSRRKLGINKNGLVYLSSLATWWIFDGFDYLINE